MIQKLKGCCGYSYTNKLQRMLQDIRISEDLRLKFQMQAGEKNILKVSHFITSQLVLTIHTLGVGTTEWVLAHSKTHSSLLPAAGRLHSFLERI